MIHRKATIYIMTAVLFTSYLRSSLSFSSVSSTRSARSAATLVVNLNAKKKSFTQQYQRSLSIQPQQVSPPSSLHAVEGDFDPDAIKNSVSAVQSGSLKAKLRALYKFTRPHTIRGTILASIAGTTRALIDTPGAIATANWGAMLPRAFIGMIALLFGNAFIVARARSRSQRRHPGT